jgi:hypothetical protein
MVICFEGEGMNWLEFTVEIVKALAWPLAVVLACLLLRKELKTLLGRIRRGKFGSAELEFEREVSELSAETPAIGVELTEVRVSETSSALSLAASNPRASILNAWLRLESALFHLVATRGIILEKRTLGGALKALHKQAVIDADDVSLINELRSLRNSAVHDESFDPGSEAALRFVELVEVARNRLQRARGRAAGD